MTEIRDKTNELVRVLNELKTIDKSIFQTSVLDITILIESLILAQDERWRRA